MIKEFPCEICKTATVTVDEGGMDYQHDNKRTFVAVFKNSPGESRTIPVCKQCLLDLIGKSTEVTRIGPKTWDVTVPGTI
jgi:hypothetical protein